MPDPEPIGSGTPAIAVPYMGLGERDKALQFLEQGYENRDRLMFLMKVSPFFEAFATTRASRTFSAA
jgi:hypothetical protein